MWLLRLPDYNQTASLNVDNPTFDFGTLATKPIPKIAQVETDDEEADEKEVAASGGL